MKADKTKIEWDASSSLNSLYFNSMGQRETMRFFVTFEGERTAVDVPRGRTVFKLKQFVRNHFNINENRAQMGDENQERPVLVIMYAGSELHDAWVLSDLVIPTGSTLKALIKEELDPLLYFDIVYDKHTVPILDRLRIRDFSVMDLRRMISTMTGLPVGVFRLISPAGSEMYDCNRADDYDIKPGDTIKLQVCDGITDVLRHAKAGATEEFMSRLPICFYADEAFGQFCCRVGLYMAAHYGHVELATTLMKQTGVKPDEYVGVHPHKQWAVGARMAQQRGRISDQEINERVNNMLGHANKNEFPEATQLDQTNMVISPDFGSDEEFDIDRKGLLKNESRNVLEEDRLEMQRRVKNARPHPDIFKAPVHEATASNQVAILKLFVQVDIYSIMCRDGYGLLPMNIALRTRQRKCATYLLTKQWTRMPYKNTSLPLHLCAKMKRWADVGREKAALKLRTFNKKKVVIRDIPLVGELINVDGYSKSDMTSGPDLPRKRELVHNRAVQIAGVLESEAQAKSYQQQGYLQQILDPVSYFATLFQTQKLPVRNSSIGSKTGAPQSKYHRMNLLGKRHVKIAGDQHHNAGSLYNSSEGTKDRESPVFKGPFSFSSDHVTKSGNGKKLPPIEEKKKKNDRREESELKSREILDRLPIPNSTKAPNLPQKYEPLPKPFYHTLPNEVNPIEELLCNYEVRHRQIPSRTLAKHCLTLASTFSNKPWLAQVGMATELVNNLIKKSVIKRSKELEA
ncbi:ankyrin repeat and ubiquitin domain containing 1 [Cichlidogyrus casuarinus]|uniref:Ankyrin repeat and ubiquitin domain containing 1 n=1 Tax=Cichlidogyrus casuarinus TaxID=1844966 RepID=A0ABD2QK08_9PLAT